MPYQGRIIGTPLPVKAPTLKYPVGEIARPPASTNSTAKSGALLATKLYIPRPRPHLVPRPHLIARLNEVYTHKLTLLSTPAGFGKTTLLAEWIRQRGIRVAWLSLDERDNEPTRFWAYVIAALQLLRKGLGEDTLTCLQSPERPALEAMLTFFINEITAHSPAGSPYILVLDDYHVIEAPAVHEGLSFVLEHLPDNLHLVIATRTDPPLPLARLRLRDELLELRAEALRFSFAEVAAFFKQVVELDLTNDEVAALAERTEGWVAALQAAALSLKGHPDAASFINTFSGSHRYIMDYLVDEVLRQQPESVQTFLLQTSILDRLCGPLCEAVLNSGAGGQPLREASPSPGLPGNGEAKSTPASPPPPPLVPGQKVLEYLEQANLFIVPLDDERRWYRYHHLFADVLRHRLELTQPQNVLEYHRRASAWFEQQGLAAEAIHHALAGQDFERAATLIEAVALPLAVSGQQATVGSWLAELPADLRLVRPHLALAYASVAVFNADFAAAEAYLREAEAATPSGDQDQTALRIEVAALRAVARSVLGDRRAPELGRMVFAQLSADHPLRSTIVPTLSYAAFAAGDLVTASHMLEEAIGSQPIQQHTSSPIQVDLVAMLALVRRAQGRLHEVRRLAMEVLAATTRDGRTLPMSGALLAYLLLGLTQYEQNELDAAERTLRQGAELAHQYQATMYEILARFYVEYILGAASDPGLIEQMEARASRFLSPLNLREFMGYRVLLWLRQGNLAAASAWAAQARRPADPDRPRFTAYDIDRFALARTLMAEGRWAAAQTAVTELLAAAEASGHSHFVIWALVWQALIWRAQGDTVAALNSLDRALALAEPEGYVRIFVDEGAPMAELLGRLRNEGGRLKEYIDKLLTAFEEETTERFEGKGQESPQPAARALSFQPLVEPLTERELEVLRLLAAGLNNRAMGEKLVIAVGTVKRHITNIYGKLGVTNRVQAVAKASELNLLPQKG